MAIDYFQIKEKDFDLAKQLIEIENQYYDETGSLDAFDIISLLRHARVYVAVENETVLGYAIYQKNFDEPEKAYLHSISIVDPQSYPSLGTSLLNITFNDLASFGTKILEVNVDPNNTNALKKYTDQLGFAICEELESDIFENNKIIILRKKL